jgi:hypothetical protein
VTRTRRAFMASAMILGALVVAGAARFTVDWSRRSAEQRHTMTCLAGYVAFIQVMGSPEEATSRLQACEQSRSGEEPLQLKSTEHPFMVEKYEGCLAAHLMLSADLERSLKEEQRYCR